MPVGKVLMQPQGGCISQALCCIKSDKHLPSELKSFRQQVICPRVYPSRVSVFLLCPTVLSPELMRAGNLGFFLSFVGSGFFIVLHLTDAPSRS